MSEKVDVTSLSLDQLSGIRKQLEAEVDHLSQSMAELKQVLGKFIDCGHSVKTAMEKTAAGESMMVPLTSSLYVQGKASGSNKFIVDIGTNYYVEKSGNEAVQFFDRKIETLNKNLVDLDKLLSEKVTMLRNMDTIYKQKFQERLAAAEAEADK